MGLQYHNLNVDVRAFMVEEIEHDRLTNRIYLSSYLNPVGVEMWPNLLLEAARNGTDDTLANALRINGCFKTEVERRKPKGGFTLARVPVTAHTTLAEAQFNQYYMRALSRVAGNHGIAELVVYRARDSQNPRPESQRMIGTRLHPQVVLDELRRTVGVEPELGIPLPNSGLTVRLP